jgi:O-antigen/teichoic acid export membrane protein
VILFALCGLVAALALGLFMPFLLTILFGSAYVAAAPTGPALAVAAFLVYVAWGYATWVIAIEQGVALLRSTAASAIVNVLSNVILIPRFGFLGSATARALSEATSVAVLLASTRTPTRR